MRLYSPGAGLGRVATSPLGFLMTSAMLLFVDVLGVLEVQGPPLFWGDQTVFVCCGHPV